MANATLLEQMLPEALRALPNPSGAQIDAWLGPWYAVADYLSDKMGHFAAGVFLLFWVFKIFNLSQAVLFDSLEYYGFLDKYLIQPDKPMAWDKRWTSYIRRHGWASWKGAVKVLIPAWSMNYAVMYYGYGAKTTDRFQWSMGETIYKLAIAFFIHDFLLWAIHYTLHQVPWLYINVHKTHHEVKNPRISISGDLTIPDYYLMDRGPPTLVAFLLQMPFPVYMLYQFIFYYTANRAHCGMNIPWDPCNWLWPHYVEYHDFHHSATHASYQTWGWWWDYLVGGHKQFYDHIAKKKAMQKAAGKTQ